MQASHVLDDAPGPNQRNPHTQAGDGTPEQRIAAQGYSQNPLPFYRNENVAVRGTSEALTDSVVEQLTKLIHDDLFVDTYASGRGHRLAMMDDNMREIGIGEVTVPSEIGRPESPTTPCLSRRTSGFPAPSLS